VEHRPRGAVLVLYWTALQYLALRSLLTFRAWVEILVLGYTLVSLMAFVGLATLRFASATSLPPGDRRTHIYRRGSGSASSRRPPHQ
jgi:hypothetical protein